LKVIRSSWMRTKKTRTRGTLVVPDPEQPER
jgi:hypothetical protein